MSDAKTKALQVLVYDAGHRRNLEENDPKALEQALDALGESKTLADALFRRDPQLLTNLMEAMEGLDWDPNMVHEVRDMKLEDSTTGEALSLIAAVVNVTECGMHSKEAQDLLWESVVVELGFWVTGGGAA